MAFRRNGFRRNVMDPKEIDRLLMPPGKAIHYSALRKSGSSQTILYIEYMPLWMVILQALVGCHDILNDTLILGKSLLKWRQRPDMDVMHQFKQTKKFLSVQPFLEVPLAWGIVGRLIDWLAC